MLNKVGDEVTYPFPNFNGATVEIWKWRSNFMPYFINGYKYFSMAVCVSAMVSGTDSCLYMLWYGQKGSIMEKR